MLIGIEGHDAAAAPHLAVQIALFNGMTGQLAAVLFAPVIYLFDEALREQLVAQAVVIPAEFLSALKIDEQRGQQVQHVIAVPAHELRRHGIGPGRRPAVILRLVHEETGHVLSEAHALFVFLVSGLNEFLRDGGVHGIDVGFVPALNDGGIFGYALFRRSHSAAFAAADDVSAQKVLGGGEVLGGFNLQEGRPVGLVLQQNAAGKAARPAVFIIAPGLHIELFGFLDAGLDAVEPFLAQILRLQAAAGVHEEAVHLEFVHDVNLAAELLGIELVVPAPERDAAVFPGMIADFLNESLHMTTSCGQCR